MTDGPTIFAPIAHDRLLGGRYRLVEFLDQGAHADVYLAHDEAGSASQDGLAPGWVVIKEMRYPHRLPRDNTFVHRFLREQSILEEVRHPHVVRYLGKGSTPRSLWIAEEYAEKGTLAGELRRRWDDRSPGIHYIATLVMARQILDALMTLHARGIIHRDIKPANILVFGSFAASAPYVKLTDFGLAHLDAAPVDITRQHKVGTEMYMPPEQMEGTCYPASDCYSLAAVIYESLTGLPPRSPWERYDPVTRYAPNVPQAVDDIVRRGLMPIIGRDARYPSAEDFARAVAAIIG